MKALDSPNCCSAAKNDLRPVPSPVPIIVRAPAPICCSSPGAHRLVGALPEPVPCRRSCHGWSAENIRDFGCRPSGQRHRLFHIRSAQGADAADARGIRRGYRAFFFHPRAHAPILAGKARIGRQRPGGNARRRHAVLFLFGRAAFSGLCHPGRAARGDLFLSHCGPHGQRDCLVLLYGLFGWKIAAIYIGTGLQIAMVAGWVIGRLQMERHLEEWVYEIQAGKIGVDTGPERLGRTDPATGSRPCATSSARSGFTS